MIGRRVELHADPRNGFLQTDVAAAVAAARTPKRCSGAATVPTNASIVRPTGMSDW
jgi:hypothetical protein